MKKILLPVAGYTMSEEDLRELENRFTYHAPHSSQVVRYTTLRAKYLELAKEIMESIPKCREEAVALTNLEQSMFWANAAIARNEYSETREDFSTRRVENYRGKEADKAE